MPSRPFQFGPQPALDRAKRKYLEASQSLAAAIQKLRESENALLEHQHAETGARQRLSLAREALASARPGTVSRSELSSMARGIAGLTAMTERYAAATRNQLRLVEVSKALVRQERAEAGHAEAALRALSRLRDERLQQHQKSLSHDADIAQEEEAISAWERTKDRPEGGPTG